MFSLFPIRIPLDPGIDVNDRVFIEMENSWKNV